MLGFLEHLHDLAEHYSENHTEGGEAALRTEGHGIGSDAVINAEDHVAEDSSSAAVQVVEKNEKLKEARRRAHAEHKAQHFTKGMFWDSAAVKGAVLAPIFTLSLWLSANAPEAFDALAIGFVTLGTHISHEAVTACRHLLGKEKKHRKTRPTPAAGDTQAAVKDFINYRRKIDVKTTAEIAVGLISSIHTMAVTEQAMIMGLCGIAMTAGPPAVTNLLIKIEETGMNAAQRVRGIAPRGLIGKLAIKRGLHIRLGDFIEDGTTRLFNVIPWFGVVAKGVTGGRVWAHGVAPLEDYFAQCADTLLHREVLWGATGAAVGIGTDMLYRKAAAAMTTQRRARLHAALMPVMLMQKPKADARQHYPQHYEHVVAPLRPARAGLPSALPTLAR